MSANNANTGQATGSDASVGSSGDIGTTESVQATQADTGATQTTDAGTTNDSLLGDATNDGSPVESGSEDSLLGDATGDGNPQEADGVEEGAEVASWDVGEIQVPEGIDVSDPVYTELMSSFKDMGLKKDQVEALLPVKDKLAAQYKTEHLSEWNKVANEHKQAVRSSPTYKEDLGYVKNALSLDSDGSFKEYLNATSQQSMKPVFEYMARVGRAMGDDVSPDNTGQRGNKNLTNGEIFYPKM